MPYKSRRKQTSGFDKYCKQQLNAVKRASKAGTRSKTAYRYQKCLATKGIKTGAGKIKSKKS